MNTIDAIAQRRSIRKYADKAVSDETIKKILKAATQAPSGKNRQPWRFIVVRGEPREKMIEAMQAGLDKITARGENTGSAKWTLQIMAQTLVTIFIFNEDGIHPWQPHSIDHNFSNIVNLQSIGAAIQNMCLASLELGLGTLWIADTLYAYEALCEFLHMDCQMVAALAIGYPDEAPEARKRKTIDEVTRWL
ncbi:MAG: nitroreductase [Anaerolineae bacterium]|nr:nitroreductase [Anaerolineae bacterium]